MAVSFFNPTNNRSRGFTMIELLVVIAIMGILAAVVAFSIRELINRGRIARAQGEINRLGKAILQLELDTGRHPGGSLAEGECFISDPGLNEVELQENGRSGLVTADPALFTNWKGPYLEDVPVDPWGEEYIFDNDYHCNIESKGCEKYPDGADVRAVFSKGENRLIGDSPKYDEDNIVYVMCDD